MEKDFDTDSTDTLIDLLAEVEEHLEYLNSSILTIEEEEEIEDVETL